MKIFSLFKNTRVIFYVFFAVEISFGIPLGLPFVTEAVHGPSGVCWGLKLLVDLRSAHLV